MHLFHNPELSGSDWNLFRMSQSRMYRESIVCLHAYKLKIILEVLVSSAMHMMCHALLCVKTGGGKSVVVQITATI
jgi:hypothetical protein